MVMVMVMVTGVGAEGGGDGDRDGDGNGGKGDNIAGIFTYGGTGIPFFFAYEITSISFAFPCA